MAASRDRDPGGATRTIAGRALLAGALATALGLTGCSGSSPGTTSNEKVGGTLTVLTVVAPQTLDPAKTNQNNAWVEQLAYEPLIVRRSDGTLTPGLATSWSYE